MIQIKTPQQIEGIKAACQVVAKIHNRVRQKLEPGLSTYQVDNIVKHSLRELEAKSAFLKYKQRSKVAFPAHSCISVNEEVVHGIGRHNKVLKEGDVITIDVGAILNGYFGDAAFTTILGQGTEEASRLVQDTKAALDTAISRSKPGVFIHDISGFIYDFGKSKNYGIITDYYGHGVGLKLHEPPQIPNFRPSAGDINLINIKLQPGMVITYEPMYCLGSGETIELDDGWTVITKDRSIAAHWEHTILITEDGVEVLTGEKKLEK